MSKPFEQTKVRSQFNYKLADKALSNSQKNYDNSRKPLCVNLMAYVLQNNQYKSSINIEGSTMLASVHYLQCNNEGYVIAYIKKDEYNTVGNPYIFCGISSARWNVFTDEAKKYSDWGESFHDYIIDYVCNCK